MKLISVENNLLNILFVIIGLFSLYLFRCIRVSLFHSLLCDAIQLVIVYLLLSLFVQYTHLLQWV